MLRLAHTQVSQGGIIINDIDDGLPNKTAKRGVGDKNKYQRDGNSLGGPDKSTGVDVNNPKQKCYIPFWKILSNNPLTYSTSIPGYIDVSESDRVLMSQDRGVISGLVNHMASDGVTPQPLISVTSFSSSDVASPSITTSILDAGNTYHLTISGANFTSLAPDVSSVKIGNTTLSATAIAAAAGGTFSDSSIVVPESLLPTVTAGLQVHAAATTNVTSLSGAQTIDGVALVATNRVLLTGQTTHTQNGVWVVASGSWTRPSDFNTGNHASGIYVTVDNGGTANGGTSWVCSTAGPTDVIGTNNLTFTLSTAATAISVTADNKTTTNPTTSIPVAAVLSSAVIGGGNLTIAGTGLRSILPYLTSVIAAGTHAGTMTQTDIFNPRVDFRYLHCDSNRNNSRLPLWVDNG